MNLYKEELISMIKSGKSTTEIAKHFNFTNECIRQNLIKWGIVSKIEKKKYTHNESFFKEPNELNCYFAGLIAADGCVYKKFKNKNEYVYFSYGCQNCDKELIERLKINLDYNGPIRQSRENLVEIQIARFEKNHEDLKNIFNIDYRKTYHLPPPNLKDENLIKAYIAGYIDGDGCIRYTNKNLFTISIVGTLDLMVWMQNFFQEKFPGYKTKLYKKNIVYYFNISGKRAINFAKYLKESPVEKLKRKWDRVPL